MAVNKYRPHMLIIPEDDACRQLANGFVCHCSVQNASVDIRPVVGGWSKMRDRLRDEYIVDLRKYPARCLILLMDFDGNVERRSKAFTDEIPVDLRDRIYLFGTLTEPEPLRRALGNSLECIGKLLADDCAQDKTAAWDHEFLRHNLAECHRLTPLAKAVLFS